MAIASTSIASGAVRFGRGGLLFVGSWTAGIYSAVRLSFKGWWEKERFELPKGSNAATQVPLDLPAICAIEKGRRGIIRPVFHLLVPLRKSTSS